MRKNSLERLALAQRLLKIEDPKYALENAYEAVREYLDAALVKQGVKSSSHEATVAYLSELGFPLLDLVIVDNLRQQRHTIKYDGGEATREEAENAIAAAERIIGKLEGKK